MPLFLLLSMAVHGLLFLIGPHLVAGLLPSFQPGDQGGLTYVTLVEAPPTERPRAAVAAAARQPQARPTPQALPEPKPPVAAEPAPTPVAASQPAPEPRPAPVQEVVAQRTAPQPADDRPQSVTPTASARPSPEPAAVQERPQAVAPVPQQPTPVVQASERAQQPTLTSERGTFAVADAATAVQQESTAGSAAATTATAGEPRRAEADPQASAPGAGAPSGSGAREDVVSSAPSAQIAPEPQLPPAGESMVREFGGHTFPKNAVGLVNGAVTVEVAAVVGADGRIIEAVIINGSGISVVDTYARNVVERGIPFKPYDAPYEMRIFITFDSRQEHLVFRYDGLIKSPPTVGSLAAGGAR